MSKRKNDGFIFDDYLHYDEELLWIGSPDPRRVLNGQDVFLIPFSLFWCTVTYSVVFMSILDAGWAGLWTLLLPHFWMGVFLFPGRFILEYMSRKRTQYAVTNQRVLIIRDWFGQKVRSYYIDRLPELEIHARKNNTGTIRFSGKPRFSNRNNFRDSHAESDFYDIPDVREVYHLIQELNFEANLPADDEMLYYESKPKYLYAR